MLRTLFHALSSQSNQKAVPAPYAAKCIGASQLKLVAGGLPKGGWLESPSEMASALPKGGWC